jgi:hypothetical protein
MYNNELHKTNLNDITKKTFREAIFLCYEGGITSIAPLAFSGDDILLFGSTQPRKSVVSIRNYCGDAELLITDTEGKFLFYGRYCIDLGIENILNQYWKIFNLVKERIETKVIKTSDFENIKISDNCTHTICFDILREYQENKLLNNI